MIPCAGFYEPCYETGKAVRWRIGMGDGKPFAIADLWRSWNGPEGAELSFTMLCGKRGRPLVHEAFSTNWEMRNAPRSSCRRRSMTNG